MTVWEQLDEALADTTWLTAYFCVPFDYWKVKIA
jgi:hypothetical protein